MLMGFVVCTVAAFLILNFVVARRAEEIKCHANVRYLIRLSLEYAGQHGGKLPVAVKDFGKEGFYVVCPQDRTETDTLDSETNSHYVLLHGGADLRSLPVETIIVREKRHNHGERRHAGFVDGRVELLPPGQ